MSPAAILWLAAGSLIAIFVTVGLVLYASKLDVRDAAWVSSTNLLASVSQQIEREVETLDMTLLDLRDGAQQPWIATILPGVRASVLFDRAAAVEGLGALLPLDDSGRVIEQAGVANPSAVDLSKEPFFYLHRGGEIGLYVSYPFVSPIDGEPSIALSRRIGRDGIFAGVAVATLKLSHVRTLFGSLDLGRGELRRREAAESALAVLAATDKLTKLANRRKFDETL